jgi:hypothetical protein
VVLTGFGLAVLAVMFLPVLIALIRRRFLVALVVFVMVIVSMPFLTFPIATVGIWLAALCVGAFAGSQKVIVIGRTR